MAAIRTESVHLTAQYAELRPRADTRKRSVHSSSVDSHVPARDQDGVVDRRLMRLGPRAPRQKAILPVSTDRILRRVSVTAVPDSR